MSLTPEKIQELKSKHGDLRQLTAEGYTIVVRRPTALEWESHQVMVLDPARRGQAPRTLVERVTVFPEKDNVKAMLEKMPGLGVAFGSGIGEFIGAGAEVEKKDL